MGIWKKKRVEKFSWVHLVKPHNSKQGNPPEHRKLNQHGCVLVFHVSFLVFKQ